MASGQKFLTTVLKTFIGVLRFLEVVELSVGERAVREALGL